MLKNICLLLILALGGCASMNVEDYKELKPEFNLFSYFEGETQASGIFFGRSGAVKTSFTLTLNGVLESEDKLILNENLTYRNGEKVERSFTITRQQPGVYKVTCPDFVGNGEIRTAGNSANWKYKLRQDIGGRVITLKFDDWMYLQPDNSILNRAYAYWFGFGVGEVFMIARKN